MSGRTLKDIWKEIVENPWLTLLFASKGVEHCVYGEYRLAAIFFGLSILSAIIWVLSDAISVDREKIIGDGGRR